MTLVPYLTHEFCLLETSLVRNHREILTLTVSGPAWTTCVFLYGDMGSHFDSASPHIWCLTLPIYWPTVCFRIVELTNGLRFGFGTRLWLRIAKTLLTSGAVIGLRPGVQCHYFFQFMNHKTTYLRTLYFFWPFLFARIQTFRPYFVAPTDLLHTEWLPKCAADVFSCQQLNVFASPAPYLPDMVIAQAQGSSYIGGGWPLAVGHSVMPGYFGVPPSVAKFVRIVSCS